MSRRASPFGRQVRALRLAAGLTQAELAEAAEISERTVSDLERGVRTAVYPATARQLASALQVEQDGLVPFLLAAHGQRKAEPEPSVGVGPLPAARRSRPPFRLTRLIGREAELELGRRLALDGPRLVTLVGPGGVGKTRLAAEVAVTTHEQFTAGSWFLDLSPLDDPRMVLTTIATNVGVQPGIGELVEALTRRLAADRVLVVLDTFEHVLAAAADVAHLEGACPGLVVLATRRSALNVRGEREVGLRPLAVRAGAVGQPTLPAAVELFLERARAVAAEVPATPAMLDAVAGICARLDGPPLAIELAAARVKHMSIADLRANLDRRLDTLSGGARDLPARHQTMRAALDWSHALLGGSEMRLFRRLSVFRGGFGPDAAGAIAAASNPGRESDALETLSALVNSSLVVVQNGALG